MRSGQLADLALRRATAAGALAEDVSPVAMVWSYVPCTAPAGSSSTWCASVLEYLRRADPGGRSLGCYARRRVRGAQNTWSVHACGRAIDWRPSSKRVGDALAGHLTDGQHGDVQLVIWNRQQWGGSTGPGWRPYDGADPHTSHLHIESRSRHVLHHVHD